MNNEDAISRAALYDSFVDTFAGMELITLQNALELIDDAPFVPPQVVQSNDAIYSLADMVLQFGCAIEREGKRYIYDTGLSALERAFSVLGDYGCPIERDGTIRLDRLLEFMAKMGGEDDA